MFLQVYRRTIIFSNLILRAACRHNMKLYKPSFKRDIIGYLLVQRVIDNWNLLDKEVFEVEKTSNFKEKYDKWIADKKEVNKPDQTRPDRR